MSSSSILWWVGGCYWLRINKKKIYCYSKTVVHLVLQFSFKYFKKLIWLIKKKYLEIFSVGVFVSVCGYLPDLFVIMLSSQSLETLFAFKSWVVYSFCLYTVMMSVSIVELLTSRAFGWMSFFFLLKNYDSCYYVYSFINE